VYTIIAHSTSTALTPLLISLAFGAGQCVVGVALVLRAATGGRWRRPGVYVASVLGAWAICSGLAELVVSGLALCAKVSDMPPAATLAGVRRTADTALLIATGVLVLPLLLYPIGLRWRSSRTAATDRARGMS
jgi:hypothetical protein